MNAFNSQASTNTLDFSLKKHGLDFKLGMFFKLIEMACRDGSDMVLVHPALILLLNELRVHFSQPITINSGYRTFAHNKAIGGKENSRHLWGMAADIHVWRTEPKLVGEYCEKLEIGGLKVYKTFVHVDVEGKDRRW